MPRPTPAVDTSAFDDFFEARLAMVQGDRLPLFDRSHELLGTLVRLP